MAFQSFAIIKELLNLEVVFLNKIIKESKPRENQKQKGQEGNFIGATVVVQVLRAFEPLGAVPRAEVLSRKENKTQPVCRELDGKMSCMLLNFKGKQSAKKYQPFDYHLALRLLVSSCILNQIQCQKEMPGQWAVPDNGGEMCQLRTSDVVLPTAQTLG